MKRFLIFACLLAAASLSARLLPSVKPDHKDGLYTSGEKAVFRIFAENDGKRVSGVKLKYGLQIDGEKEKSGIIVSSEKPFELTAVRNTPGRITIQVSLLDADDNPVMIMEKGRKVPCAAYTGAMYDKEKIAPARPCPADFDQFWADSRKELDAVPMQATVVDSKIVDGKFRLDDVAITCAGNKPVRGYLAMPENAKSKSLPALLTVQGAGVRSSQAKVALLYSKKFNCIAMDVNAHGIENGRDADFYKALDKGALADYRQRGKTDRNAFYFRGMFLRVLRALEYLKSLPQWDGKNLVVCGSSQGGAQTIVAAALDPQVTAAIAGVPALCDHAGALAGRVPGWPKVDPTGKNAKVQEAVAYCDMVNFAHLIHCPIVVFTGFADTTCNPAGVMAFYNQLPEKTEKKLYTVPQGRHATSRFSGFDKTLKRFLRLHK